MSQEQTAAKTTASVESLKTKDVIRLSGAENSALQLVVRDARLSEAEPHIVFECSGLLRLSKAHLERVGFWRMGKWSGTGAVPPIGSQVFVSLKGLGLATVATHEVEQDWLGLCVRFHQPPDWLLRQNKDPNALALIFGAEIRQ